ncbi:MAG: hypothetical protein ACRYFK_14485 [Janthinobacterium lividum]
MKLLDKTRPDRVYSVRTQTLSKVQKALNIEQSNRQGETGTKDALMSIVADWLEEKADAVLKAKK